MSLLSVGAFCLLCSCERRANHDVEADAVSEVLVVVGDREITRTDLQRELNARPAGSYSTAADRERLLESMIQREVLLSRALAEGFDKRPEIQVLTEVLIANRYREARWSEWSSNVAPPTPEAIAEYYRVHLAEFTSPPAVRAGVIRIDCNRHVSTETRRELLEHARQVLATAEEASDQEFRELVQRHSDDQASRYTGGDTGWLEPGEPTFRWPEPVVQSVFALEEPGQVAPLIDSEAGFFIVRLAERRETTVRPLADVSDLIAHQLTRQREIQAEAQFAESLRAGLPIDVNEAALESIWPTVSTQTASVPALPSP